MFLDDLSGREPTGLANSFFVAGKAESSVR
jgi:hypothetical protein